MLNNSFRRGARVIALCLILGLLCAPSMAEERALTLSGEMLSSGMVDGYQQAHPDCTVTLDSGGVDGDRLLLALTTGEAAADVYVLSTATGILTRMNEKGFCADLSVSPPLAGFCGQAPAAVQAMIEDPANGFIALPYAMNTSQLFGFNTAVGEALGYALSNRPLSGAAERFLGWGINTYVAQWGDPQAHPLDFETAAFRSFLTCLDDHLADLQRLGEAEGDRRSVPADHALIIEEYPLLVTSDNADVTAPSIQPFLLSLTDETAAPVLPATVYAFVVSKAAAHPDEALSYLTYMVHHATPEQQVFFTSADPQPVEDAAYAENVAYYDGELQALSEAMTACAEDELPALRVQQSRLQAERNALEDARWYITQDSLDQYRALRDSIVLLPAFSFNYYITLPNVYRLMVTFLQGETTADGFLREFNSLQRMMNAE